LNCHLMPQFDTFSFLSQLFWVFSCFCVFYASLVYYLLPALSMTLKIRRRKLFLTSSQSVGVSSSNLNFISLLNILFAQISKELSTRFLIYGSVNNILSSNQTNNTCAAQKRFEEVESLNQSHNLLCLEKTTLKSFFTNFSTRLVCLTVNTRCKN